MLKSYKEYETEMLNFGDQTIDTLLKWMEFGEFCKKHHEHELFEMVKMKMTDILAKDIGNALLVNIR